MSLSDEVKTFIVQQLACFDTPSVVAKAVKDEFGVEVTRQSVEAYDPNKRAGQALGPAFREIFEATRKAFIEDTAEVGIAHKGFRLRVLHRMATQAEGMRNFALVAQLMEQAAKEIGGAFTNKREISGPDGKPIRLVSSTMTAKEAQDAYAATLHGDEG